MLIKHVKIIVCVWLLLLNACSSMPTNNWMDNGLGSDHQVNNQAMSMIQQLIQQQPGKNTIHLIFLNDETSLDKEHIQQISQWLVRPLERVEIKVGPVRHQDVITAINISRQRGKRVLMLLNTFKIPARVTYDPSLPRNSIEVAGWL